MPPSNWNIQPLKSPFRQTLYVPGDKSISHRVAMLAGLAQGKTDVKGFLASEDCLDTLNAIQSLGAKIHFQNPTDKTAFTITGVNGKFTPPSSPINCGNSGTAMRLLSGILAAQPFSSELYGDPSLSSRPMQRIIIPLEKMGAKIQSTGNKHTPPLHIQGKKLSPITYTLPIASAQVKSAILLAALFTQGETTITEPSQTRDHTEQLFQHFGITLKSNGLEKKITAPQIPNAKDILIPGDISSAAFWLVATAITPNAQLTIQNVGLNPTRTKILDVLQRMGAHITITPNNTQESEPAGTIEITGSTLHATTIQGDEIPNLIDEIPILSIAAARAQGTTIIRDAAELRVKESDRLQTTAQNLQRIGISVKETPDGLEILGTPNTPFKPATLPSFGDHRIAMSFAIAGIFAEDSCTIEDTQCVETSYPGFQKQLETLTT